MTLLQALLLGIIQGLTEFIPVSSSGHLILIPEILEWEVQTTSFDISVHAATTLALIIYFRNDILFMINKIQKRTSRSLIVNIIITTIPAAIIGIFFEDAIDEIFKDISTIAAMLIIVGLVMLFIDRFTRDNQQKIETLKKKQSFLIGIFQSVAFIRGTSRSGITLIGGMLTGLSRQQAVRYAFLAGIPILTAVSLKQFVAFSLEGFGDIDPMNIIIGFIASFFSGLIAIRVLLLFLKENSLKIFGVYRIILGILILIVI